MPPADKAKTSDPYARFTLLNGRAGVSETGRTQPVYNDLNPTWPHNVQIMLGAGTEAAMEQAPRLLVQVYDKDLTDADDLLGECEVVLGEGSGSQEELQLTGVGTFGNCSVSFKHELSTLISPPATLRIYSISAAGLPKPKKGNKSKTGSSSSGGGGGGGSGGALADPFLRFHLLEVGDVKQTAVTPTMPNTATPDWGELELELALPRGSARPALLTIGLWDNDVKDADDALAFEDVRLSAGGGEHSVKMVGSKGSGCKHVTVSFTVAVVEDA